MFIDRILKNAVGLGYLKWGAILLAANGAGVYTYYRQNRDKNDLEAYQLSATRYASTQAGKFA